MTLKRIFSLFLAVCLSLSATMLLTSCGGQKEPPEGPGKEDPDSQAETVDAGKTEIPADLAEDVNTLAIECVEGTADCWHFEGKTLVFTELDTDTVCAVTGELDGNIVIDVGEDFDFELEMRGLTLACGTESPITVLSREKVTLTAKKGTENYVYDTRAAVADAGDAHTAAIYSTCDLQIGGKGELTVISSGNNGIHTKDDLKIKNLTLSVTCENNALKGNDSVTVEGGILTLVARRGDGIKTSNSDVSQKGNQRGIVTLSGCAADIYAACDGIDAAFDAQIGEDTVLRIFTDKYSPYSEEGTAVDEDYYYIRFTSKNYSYSLKYYNGEDDFVWANATYRTSVNAGRGTYYYFAVPKAAGYEKVQFYMYSADQTLGQDEDYLVCSDLLTWNTAYDTFALTQNGSSLGYCWTNYTTSDAWGMGGPGGPGGPGGMMEGNPEKRDYSTKGIKAANEILVSGGSIFVKSYDDALHANGKTALENGDTSTGNVTVSGGTLELYSNDDGIHADGTLTVLGGKIDVTNSYEGLEGATVLIEDGVISIVSRDDGINATATAGTGLLVSGGTLFVFAGGDGLDTNTRTSYQGIVFTGGDVTVISTSSGNSSLDTEQGYTYTGGRVLALCPSGGMSSEATHCRDFASVGSKTNLSLKQGQTLRVKVNGQTEMSLEMPCSLSALAIYLGAPGATFSAD